MSGGERAGSRIEPFCTVYVARDHDNLVGRIDGQMGVDEYLEVGYRLRERQSAREF